MNLDVSRLAPEMRAELAALWQARADSESSVRKVFHQLVRELIATGAHPAVIAHARSAAGDEARHAAVCTELATVYRGAYVPSAIEPAIKLPDYVADKRLRAALHVVNLCCVGETLAVAFVDACIDECEDPVLREIHRRHMADEVRHARLGWAHLASLPAEVRAAIAPWIGELVRANQRAWETRIAELPEAGIPGHGYPPRAQLIAAVRNAVRDLVLPGFAYVGITMEISREKAGPEHDRAW